MTTQEILKTLDEQVNAEDIPVILAEYNSLRAEILKRIEIKHQLTSLALIAPSTIIAVGFTSHNAFIILSYPILACFLSGIWIANTHGVRELSNYIQGHIEPKLGRNILLWESYHPTTFRPFRFVDFLVSGAIFVFTELLAILAGLTIAKFTVSEIILLVFAILSIIFNVIMLVQLERKRGNN